MCLSLQPLFIYIILRYSIRYRVLSLKFNLIHIIKQKSKLKFNGNRDKQFIIIINIGRWF